MQSNHRPGLAVMIGIGKPKGSGTPPPKWDDQDDPMQEPGADAPNAEDPQDQQKVSPEEAGVYTGQQKCSTCEYYIHAGHMCQKVDGNNFGTEVVGCQLWEPEGESSGGDTDDDMTGAPAPQGEQYGGSNNSKSGY